MVLFTFDEQTVLHADLTCRKELHNLFAVDKFPRKVAVIYDDGENGPGTQTFEQIDSMANCIRSYFEILESSGKPEPGGFVGVACSQNIWFPAVLLGIMRSNLGFYNIDQSSLLEDIKFAQFTISMKYLVVEDQIFQGANLKIKSILKESIATYEYKEDNKTIVKIHIFLLEESVTKTTKTNYSGKYAFAIRTSGTTGSKKMVLVPSSCIVPNITYFSKYTWKMNSKDIVFGASPVTFDPSIVELFTTLASGATILYVPQRVKLIGELLAKILMKHRVTILQMTPSLFRRIETNLVSEGMFNSEKSSLEILAFGGEKCLEKVELRKIIDAKMFNKLFQRKGLQNLYGITEVSCWATVEHINLDSEENIEIGNPILNTCIHFGEDGSISIGSQTRVCTTLDSNGDPVACSFKKGTTYFFDTGDIGLVNERCTGISYVTRKDRIVKRNGYKTSLVEIEKAALATKLLQAAQCVFYNDKIYLIIKLINSDTSENHLTPFQRINEKFIPKLWMDIPPQIYPDVIVPVEEIPVNQNGKIDMNRILSISENQKHKNPTLNSFVHFKFQKEQFLDALENIWAICTNNQRKCLRSDENVDDTDEPRRFTESGGDSLSAVRFIEEAFTYLNLFGSDVHAKYEKEVFKLLILEDFERVATFLCDIAQRHPVNVSVTTLPVIEQEKSSLEPCNYSPNVLISYPLEAINALENQDGPLTTKTLCKRKHNASKRSFCAKSPPEIAFSSSYDLRMCVDSSAAVISGLHFVNGAIVIMGSHSGCAIAISLTSFHKTNKIQKMDRFPVLWEVQLGGRVESDAAGHPNMLSIYLGTHNKRLYSLNVLTGHINWRFECNGSIRASPVLTSDGQNIIFVDETSLYCLNPQNGEMIWKRDNLKHMSTCIPALSDENVFITTVTNKIEAIELRSGSKIWTKTGKSSDMRTAYCTSPVQVTYSDNSQKLLLVGTRNGCLECLNQENGEIIWTCQELEVTNFSPDTVPFAPLTHCFCDKCDCDESFIIFLNRIGKGVIIVPKTGVVLKSFDLSIKTLSSPCIMCINTSNSFLNPHCEESTRVRTHSRINNITKYMVFYTEATLTFVDVDNPEIRFDLKTDFDAQAENFSKPVQYDNYILVGGRDNKLHVFEMAAT